MTHRAIPLPPQVAPCGAELQPEHAPGDKYKAFLDRAGLSVAHRCDLDCRRRTFAARWPDLREWLRMPLLERVGRPNGKSRRDLRDRVSYNARSYLIYLCLTDRLRLDYDYLLAVGQLQTMYVSRLLCGDFGVAQLADEAQRLGFWRFSANLAMSWTLPRIALHTGIRDPSLLRLEHLDELTLALREFNKRPDFALFWPEAPGRKRLFKDRPTHDVWFGHISRLRNVLYHRGQIAGPPRAGRRREVRSPPAQPEMRAMVDRWLDLYRPVSRPSTTDHRELALRRFLEYLARADPQVRSFSQVTREHALGFIDAMAREVQPTRGRKLAVQTRRTRTGELDFFFRDLIRLGWDGPGRPLLDRRDRPPQVQRVPRFIPADELGRLMAAVAKLPCPFQRCALLVARWSGARRAEVKRLTLDCLDTYPDGTGRLRVPASKTYTERTVPLHEDAAAPLRALIGKRKAEPDRPLADELTGDGVRYVFVSRGVLLSTAYLFDYALQQACTDAGLVHSDGQRTVTAHRFRHTIGTVLAERGAKLHTIMSVLGHRSPGMVMVYARISDPEVLRDYKAVLDADATIAGPGAEVIQSGALTQASVDWLKTNFLKTALELGHCLRLPAEGPCECDLFFTCSRFVTTPAYAPRLRERHQLELTLVEDAQSRGWAREAERHRCIAERIGKLLADMGMQA
jgi:integrase